MKNRLFVLWLMICLALSGGTGSAVGESLDYSDHTDPYETFYETVLGDPSKLSAGERVLALQEKTADWSWIQFNGLVKEGGIGYDVRTIDLSGYDLSIVEDYNDLSFSSDTVWPEILPEGFDPDSILEFNQNPGLGIRALHEKGITGEGVGIAIIDKALLLDHEQYKENLMYYERIHCADDQAQMHGPAVASIAVGKTVGVAPGAKLYYIAATKGHFRSEGYDFDASIIADCVLRVLEINEYLPDHEKIKVISISNGYKSGDKGYAELVSAIRKADEQNIFVMTTQTGLYYSGFRLMGMNRDYFKDPDDFNSYLPAGWIAEEFYSNPSLYQDWIFVPMGSRTYATCTGPQNYEIMHEGGLSEAVPWCAGFYALCCQVNPDITPREFAEIVKSTGVTTDLAYNNQTIPFGKIINPAAVIDVLQQK